MTGFLTAAGVDVAATAGADLLLLPMKLKPEEAVDAAAAAAD